MPYTKMGRAIARFLHIINETAERYGNPFRVADLPDNIVIGANTYSKNTIKRYIDHVKLFYRKIGREPPIEIRYAVTNYGKVLEIYVDKEKIEEEIRYLRQNEDLWYISRRMREARRKRNYELEYLRRKNKELREKIEKLEERIKVLERKLRRKKHGRKSNAVIARILSMPPQKLAECVEKLPETPECIIAASVIEKALRVIDRSGTTTFDIATIVIDDEYVKELEKKIRKLRARE